MTLPAKNAPKESDKDMLVRVASADRQALEVLYLGYHRRLARFLVRFTPRYENVEEIINDTFMVVGKGQGFSPAPHRSQRGSSASPCTALKSLRRQKNHAAALEPGRKLAAQTADSVLETEVQDWLTPGIEADCSRTAPGPRAGVQHGSLAGGNRSDHRRSRRDRQGAHVSRARESCANTCRLDGSAPVSPVRSE